MHEGIHLSMFITYVQVYTCVYCCVCICLCTNMYIYIYTYIYAHTYMSYVCVFIYILCVHIAKGPSTNIEGSIQALHTPCFGFASRSSSRVPIPLATIPRAVNDELQGIHGPKASPCIRTPKTGPPQFWKRPSGPCASLSTTREAQIATPRRSSTRGLQGLWNNADHMMFPNPAVGKKCYGML